MQFWVFSLFPFQKKKKTNFHISTVDRELILYSKLQSYTQQWWWHWHRIKPPTQLLLRLFQTTERCISEKWKLHGHSRNCFINYASNFEYFCQAFVVLLRIFMNVNVSGWVQSFFIFSNVKNYFNPFLIDQKNIEIAKKKNDFRGINAWEFLIVLQLIWFKSSFIVVECVSVKICSEKMWRKIFGENPKGK